jgi:hypothetical protein
MIELLLALLMTATGIERSVDADLTAIAERRVAEISACAECFTHEGQPADTWEVLAYTDNPDPARAVEVWLGSPDHAAILTDPSLTRIGCAHRLVSLTHYYACELRQGSTEQLPVLEPSVLPDVAAETQTGIASWYGPGNGVATQWCTWTLRHTEGCGLLAIQSHQTGLTVIVPVVDWCQCYRGTSDERIVDLQWGVVDALGLDRADGLYPVTTWRVDRAAIPPALPDTAVSP